MYIISTNRSYYYEIGVFAYLGRLTILLNIVSSPFVACPIYA